MGQRRVLRYCHIGRFDAHIGRANRVSRGTDQHGFLWINDRADRDARRKHTAITRGDQPVAGA